MHRHQKKAHGMFETWRSSRANFLVRQEQWIVSVVGDQQNFISIHSPPEFLGQFTVGTARLVVDGYESAASRHIVIVAAARARRTSAQLALHSREKFIRRVAIRSLLPLRIGGVENGIELFCVKSCVKFVHSILCFIHAL
jgi:hypothetical protein